MAADNNGTVFGDGVLNPAFPGLNTAGPAIENELEMFRKGSRAPFVRLFMSGLFMLRQIPGITQSLLINRVRAPHLLPGPPTQCTGPILFAKRRNCKQNLRFRTLCTSALLHCNERSPAGLEAEPHFDTVKLLESGQIEQ
jgi:hypothetical protein